MIKPLREEASLTHWFPWQEHPCSHQGLLLNLFLHFSLEYWPLAFMSPICPPAQKSDNTAPCCCHNDATEFPALEVIAWISTQEYEVDLHPEKTALLPRVFQLASAGGRMIGRKSPWPSLVSGAVLAFHKSHSAMGGSAQAFLLQV